MGLGLPNAPWYGHRDRLASLMAALSIYTASLGKMALDIALLMQFEVSEAGRRGSRRIVHDAARAQPHRVHAHTRGGEAYARIGGEFPGRNGAGTRARGGRMEAGFAVRRMVLGDAHVDRAIANNSTFLTREDSKR